MSTTTRISTAERLGRSFGRGWRAYVRGERRASNWLVSKGVPVATLEELRETPGYDPNLYNDTSHEMYKDDD